MAKSKPAPLKTKGAAPSCGEMRSHVPWPAGCQSSGKEGGLKRGLHGKVKTRTLKDEGCGTQLQGEEKLRVVAGGLPEFDGVAFGVVETGEAAVGVGFGVEGDFDAGGAELGEDGFEIGDAEVDHPLERLRRFGVPEIPSVAGEGREGCGTGLLLPGRIVVVCRDRRDAEMRGVPGGERLGIARAEEESADAENFFHGASERKRRHITENTEAPPRPGGDKRRTRKRGPNAETQSAQRRSETEKRKREYALRLIRLG